MNKVYTSSCEQIGKLALYYLHRSNVLQDFMDNLNLQDRRVVHEWVLDPNVDLSIKSAVIAAFDDTRKRT
jgi:hypothetical protein